MVLTPTQLRRSLRGDGGIDLAPEPRRTWRDRQKALDARAHFAHVTERPFDPHGHKVPLSPINDRRVRQCFSRFGYGDGYAGVGTCMRGQCPDADECYSAFRAIVEAVDARAITFNIRHQALTLELRAKGDPTPGNSAMQRLAADPNVVRPLEEAAMANNELGRIDTGKWARCSTCDRVPMKAVMVQGHCPRCAEQQGLT